MIITDKFVILNFPKTGSTFVRKVLKQIHGNNNLSDKSLYNSNKRPCFINLWVPNIRDDSFRYGIKDEHGIYIQIPEEHKNKRIISVKRNLFKRYISLYEFADWKKTWRDKARGKASENFPNLSFSQFMEIGLEYNPFEFHPKIMQKLHIGAASAQFILFYYKNPFETIKKVNQNYIKNQTYNEDMATVEFLDLENLNVELYQLLIESGYRHDKINFILHEDKINNSTPQGKQIMDYFSEDLISRVKQKDQFLFSIFEDYYV